MSALSISIIMPARNEAEGIGDALRAATAGDVLETIVVDGGSSDDTIATAKRGGARVIQSERGRGVQLHSGAVEARGDILLFIHADTILPHGFASEVHRCLAHPDVIAGAFPLRLNAHGPKWRLLERTINLRSRLLQLPYGDQGLFLRAADYHDAGGYPLVPIMEDLELVLKLRRRGRIALAATPVRTSARRWQRLGVSRTTLLNQRCLIARARGVPHDTIASWYAR